MRRKYLNAKFIIGALCLATIFVLAILGNFITPHDAQEQDLLARCSRRASAPTATISAPTISAAISSRAWYRAHACRSSSPPRSS